MRHYKKLPKKYDGHVYLDNEGSCAWSEPVEMDGYVYYIYITRMQGDCNKVYRFSKDRHDRLFNLGLGLSSTIKDGLDPSCFEHEEFEPYIVTDKIF